MELWIIIYYRHTFYENLFYDIKGDTPEAHGIRLVPLSQIFHIWGSFAWIFFQVRRQG